MQGYENALLKMMGKAIGKNNNVSKQKKTEETSSTTFVSKLRNSKTKVLLAYLLPLIYKKKIVQHERVKGFKKV